MLELTPRILVIEDDRDFGELLRIALESEGYGVSLVDSGIRLLPHALAYRPDLILLDIVLPWVNGFELCKALREHREFQNTPIFVMTAKDSSFALEQALLAGANEYFAKPLDLPLLIARIKEHVLPSRS